MALHTDLTIHKTAYDLFDAIMDLAKNMPRDFKALIGAELRKECIAILVLIRVPGQKFFGFRANCAMLTFAILRDYHARTGSHSQSGLVAWSKGGRAASNAAIFSSVNTCNPVWAAVWEGASPAGSFTRSTNLHRCPPSFSSERGRFNQTVKESRHV
jgi:hypothetical protein